MQNIGGTTIHSKLQITSIQGNFRTRAYVDNELRSSLMKVETIIIEEVSMVTAELLDYISNIFANLHNNTLAFGGINIILVKDLAQLPPVTGSSVFHASVWKLFYPLFLKTPQCQNSDEEFYHMLEEIRMGILSSET